MPRHARPDPLTVREDAVRTGEWLHRRSGETRELRRVGFRYGSMREEAKRLAGDPGAPGKRMYGAFAGFPDAEALSRERNSRPPR